MDLMLQDPALAVRDVIDRGLIVDAPDDTKVMVMDQRYRFAIFNAKGGKVQGEPYRGPYFPDDIPAGDWST